jgi:stage II sporulation protein D (peptidoglycan lytic transglycosylase)
MGRLWPFCAALLALSALMAVACSTARRPAPLAVPASKSPEFIRVRLADGSVRRVALEDYVHGTILSEFAPPSGDPALIERMLEVQAVIARTYAVSHLARHGRDGFDLCSTTHCQLYQPSRIQTSTWSRPAGEAVAQTAGMVLWYGSGPASVLFHADCGGHTSAVADVWPGPARPYLASIADDGPARAAHTTWEFEVETKKLLAALNADARTRVGKRLTAIAPIERDDAGRARLVALRGTRQLTVRGEELRVVLTRAFGAKSVRSTSFDVTKRGSGFVFEGRGYGHGVGLCQVGALARLKAGAQPEQILSRYYPGTRLVVLR